MGIIHSTGLLSIIATGAGVGGAIANAITAFTMPTQHAAKLIPRRIRWRNRSGVAANLLIGYGDRTLAGSLFRQVFPSIWMLNGIDDELVDLPIMGNTPEGFMVDTRPTPAVAPFVGTLGNILIETDSALVAAAPGDVQVIMDIEVG